MKRSELMNTILELFEFKTVTDQQGREFVFFKAEPIDENMLDNIEDKTALEATANHIHLINHIKKEEFKEFCTIGKRLGGILLNYLQLQFPKKQFAVFVSITLHDSMTIRFHQIWENEPHYFYPEELSSTKCRIYGFYSELRR